MTIQSTYPANFVEITRGSKETTLNIQSHPEYSVTMNQTLHNFFVNTSNVSVMNVRCPLGS